ncbi:MAG: aminopeptidase [Comamonas sp.]
MNQSIRVRHTQSNKVQSVVSLGRPCRAMPWWRCGAGLAAALLLAGCAAQSPLGYYWQAAAGQVRLLAAARPVEQAAQDPQLPPALRQRLARTQQIRSFASQQLHLPDNASYRRYADLGRNSAVWNVVAAPVDALELHRWCYPVLGCVGYRGYFAEADAQQHATQLRQQGLEVHVYGVPAYSTLGWFNWLGGDPLLNTFIRWSEPELAGLLFHELAHQLLYVQDDTAFNESFATAVQRLGTQQWLATQAAPALQAAFAAAELRRQQWRDLTRSTRAALAQLYADHALSPLTADALQARKQAVLTDFRQRYAQLRAGWQQEWQAVLAQRAAAIPPATAPTTPPADPWALTDAWVAQANNASFAALGAYEDWVPAFEAMHQQAGGSWPRFYDAVRALARQPAAQRQAALCAALPSTSPLPDCVRHPD